VPLSRACLPVDRLAVALSVKDLALSRCHVEPAETSAELSIRMTLIHLLCSMMFMASLLASFAGFCATFAMFMIVHTAFLGT
jgi:hypothetical protein